MVGWRAASGQPNPNGAGSSRGLGWQVAYLRTGLDRICNSESEKWSVAFGGSGWSTAMGDTTAGVPRDPKDVSDFMADVLIDADGWRLGEPL